MTPRPEDVALVNRAADMLVMQPVQAGYGAAQRLNTSNQLRALASRLEGEGRDGEPGYARCTSMAKGRVRCPNRATKMYLAARVGVRHPVRVFRCDEHPLGNASAVATLPAPASSPQPTTTTETTPAGGGS